MTLHLCRTRGLSGNTKESSRGCWTVQGYPLIITYSEYPSRPGHWQVVGYAPPENKWNPPSPHHGQLGEYSMYAMQEWMVRTGLNRGPFSPIPFTSRAQALDAVEQALITEPFPWSAPWVKNTNTQPRARFHTKNGVSCTAHVPSQLVYPAA